jgi:hypothetical protein
MSFLSGLTGILGYETLPQGIEGTSFYDLKASMPGKDKMYDFVSGRLIEYLRWPCEEVAEGGRASSRASRF